MAKKLKDFPIGKKVRGYGLLNEYGEFDFIPEETGKNKGKLKMVKVEENFSVSVTERYIIVHQKMQKCNGLRLVTEYLKVVDDVIKTLREYEF